MISWVVLLVTVVLEDVGAISQATQLFVFALVIGYSLGRLHALHSETEADRQRLVCLLSQGVDQMGTALASGELSDDEQTALQHQRQTALALLALTDRPSLHQRVLARLRR